MKPILFNTEMVKAILEGRKTVTRRVIKPEQNETLIRKDVSIKDFIEGIGFTNGLTPEEIIRASYKASYKVGDILYVRETWHKAPYRILYKANYPDNEKFYQNGEFVPIKWRPSIHMPKEAARIFLRVTDVRVERLQDITDEQAEAEGFNDYTSTALGFPVMWDNTIKPDQFERYGWHANPYVWVIEFERVDLDSQGGIYE